MWITVVLVAATVVLVALHLARAVRHERRAREVGHETRQAGLTEPVSLHPVIDDAQCIGCAACVEACPEKGILGLVDGHARLVEPTSCIGHGACRESCPTHAITLVFGSERRGVDIPLLQPTFETNVPGIYIAGELGGMGLIRNAVEQGRQAIESIAAGAGAASGADLDVVVVGAGPAGFAATLAAMERRLRSVTLEQDSLGGTVAHYPRRKLVMTAPVRLPLVGQVRFRETTKEELLEFWRDVERRTGAAISYQERLEDVRRVGQHFVVTSSRREYRTRAVLLAIGRRGSPRKLGVPGEERSKVVYRLIEPEQYRAQRVLVVGGGDSALEAALAVSEQPETAVHLVYRGEAFQRAKPANRRRLEEATAKGHVETLLRAEVRQIDTDRVLLDHDGAARTLANDAVVICAGGALPTPFLTKLGITVETKYGTA